MSKTAAALLKVNSNARCYRCYYKLVVHNCRLYHDILESKASPAFAMLRQ